MDPFHGQDLQLLSLAGGWPINVGFRYSIVQRVEITSTRHAKAFVRVYLVARKPSQGSVVNKGLFLVVHFDHSLGCREIVCPRCSKLLVIFGAGRRQL
jgi:hypothetical protein